MLIQVVLILHNAQKLHMRLTFDTRRLWTLWQGVDWRDHANWGCNGGLNPYMELLNDGISLVRNSALLPKPDSYHEDWRPYMVLINDGHQPCKRFNNQDQ